MQTDFSNFANTPTSPIRSVKKITPSDTSDFETPKLMQFMSAGTVSVIFAEDDDDNVQTYTFESAVDQPWMLRRVLATGCTITEIRACY